MKRAADRKGPPMNLSQIAQTLTASSRLTLPPIAICFTDKVPAGIKNWAGRVPAGCRFWQEAATEAHDAARREALKTFADPGYVRERDVALIPVLESRSSHVIYGPLATIPLASDVVPLFGKGSALRPAYPATAS
jgi:hypothetical protein